MGRRPRSAARAADSANPSTSTATSCVVGDEILDLRSVRRIAIVGAGKASGAMAVALERVLGAQLLAEKQVTGWVNVPADCILPTRAVHLHAARPAGVNEPRPEGVEGTQRILEIVSSLGPEDVCFCLLSGGGSALLPAPAPGISLDDKIRVARVLSAAGANIDQLNTVRSQLSLVKAGGLARACRAGRLISLDHLRRARRSARADRLRADRRIASITPPTRSPCSMNSASSAIPTWRLWNDICNNRRGRFPLQASRVVSVTNLVIGNNALAVDAAGCEAERLGYSHAMIAATAPEGPAEEVGRHLAEMALRMRSEPGPDCLISGGEPTVTLVDESARGKGGRNQQLALAALSGTRRLRRDRAALRRHRRRRWPDGRGRRDRHRRSRPASSAAATRSARLPAAQRRVQIL